MKPAILGFLSCFCLCAQQASLEGIAIDAVTQMPLAGVHISLISNGAGTNLPEPDDAYGAISNAAGRYSIGNIRPGDYNLEPTHTGYVYFSEKNPATPPFIALKPGEQAGGFRIAMTPEATITGRVIDEFGDPVQGVGVQLVAVADVAPYGLWKMREETDDRGEYRISGLPGRYYVEASVHPLAGAQPEIRTDGSLSTAYAPTFYPGALAKERGKSIEAIAGRELAGIDIHVAHRKSLKITGVVTGPLAAGATVTILISHENGEGEEDATAGADGSFRFENLAPSDYWLRAAAPTDGSGDSLHSPVIQVTVENDDGTVTLPLTTGETMAGAMEVEGDPAGRAPGEQWTVRLTPADPHGTPTKDGEVSEDGSFVISRIVPGTYIPEIDPLPENAYIKSLVVGGVETGRQLDLTKGVGGATMKITVNRNGGQVTGIVADNQGHPLIGRHLFIVLAEKPDDVMTWRNAVSAADASFALHGIRPGKYHLFAIDPVGFGGLKSYEPLKGIAARAEEIEIRESSRVAKEVHPAGKDEIGGK